MTEKEQNTFSSADGDAAVKPRPQSQFRRSLVPLDEYAEREGLSSEIVEKQGQLGVVQIRKYKGRKYVVDVPLSTPESEDEKQVDEILAAPAPQILVKRKPSVATAFLIVVLVACLGAISWFYADAQIKLNRLAGEYESLQMRYDDLVNSSANGRIIEDTMAGSRAELAGLNSRISDSRIELRDIQSQLSDARRDLEGIQNELMDIQSRITLSRNEIEQVQNDLTAGGEQLDSLYRAGMQP